MIMDDGTPGKNENSNANTAEKGQYATNYEMPRVQKGNKLYTYNTYRR